MQRAFTLIELLIVVAIITILSAIAVPNFLEAQTRAKTSRALADMRTFATALNVYQIDWNCFPLDGAVTMDGSTIFPTQHPSDQFNQTKFVGPGLTTPIAYLISQPVDPFARHDSQIEFDWYFYTNFPQAAKWLHDRTGSVPPPIQQRMDVWGNWLLMTSGPDGDRKDIGASGSSAICDGYYDATNGTLSNGDIIMAERLTITGR